MKSIPAFYFDESVLSELASRRHEDFVMARPFPHIVIDDFLPAEILDLLIREFPREDAPMWEHHGPGRTRALVPSNKLGQSNEKYFGDFTRHIMAQFNSSTFVRFIEQLAGVGGIITDPAYSGCGLHSTGRGGRLMMHTDMNRHPHTGRHLHQILNFILYLNEDWKDEYGGHLELWTADRKPEKRIAPIANRAVLFSTGTRSIHGHPQALTCPEGRRRNSLAIYYYTYKRAVGADYDGVQQTVRWIATSEDDKDVQSKLVRLAVEILPRIAGQSLVLPRAGLPFDVPNWTSHEDVYVQIFSWETTEEKTRRAIEERLGRAGASVDDLVPFALLKDVADGGFTEQTCLAAFDSSDGAVHLLAPDTDSLPLFLGFLPELFGTLSPAMGAFVRESFVAAMGPDPAAG